MALLFAVGPYRIAEYADLEVALLQLLAGPQTNELVALDLLSQLEEGEVVVDSVLFFNGVILGRQVVFLDLVRLLQQSAGCMVDLDLAGTSLRC